MNLKELNLDSQARYFDAFVAARKSSTLPRISLDDYPVKKPDIVGVPWMKFALYADDYVKELCNAIELFRADIHRLEGWSAVLPSVPNEVLPEIIEGSVLPLLAHTVTIPYGLKDRFIYCTASLLHHSAQVLTGGEEDEWKDKSVRRQDYIKRFGKRAGDLSVDLHRFDSVLQRLCPDKSEIDELRNRIVHRLPPNVEYGSATTLARIAFGNKVAYSFAGDPPLRIRDALPLLIVEHQTSTEVFGAFYAQLQQMIAGLENSTASGTAAE